MGTSAQQKEHAVDRAAKVFSAIKSAAEMKLECPSSALLAERIDCSKDAIGNSIQYLESNGMISVERSSNGRTITICATGLKTASRFGGQSIIDNVAELLADGESKAEITRICGYSARTVNNAISKIKTDLGWQA